MTDWIKASACSGGDCVEVRADYALVHVRDSSNPWPVLRFTHAEWAAFLDAAKNGEFDHLITTERTTT